MAEKFSNIKNLENCGIQKVCKDSSGVDKTNFYVCDTEGVVLKFNKSSLLGSDSPKKFEIDDGTLVSIAWHKEVFVAYSAIDFINGSDKKNIGKVVDDNFNEVQPWMEFQLNATCVDMNETVVVAGSSDYKIKMANLLSPKNEKTLKLEGEPTSVKICPKNEFIAVSTIDGNVTIVQLDSFEVVQTLKNVFPNFEAVHHSNSLVILSWSRDGGLLFVPSRGCVKCFQRNTWKEEKRFASAENDDQSVFSTSCVSICGKYLAASTMNNEIFVWSIETKEIVANEKYTRITTGKSIIVSIEFAPFSEDLIVADSNRGICVFHVFGNGQKEDMESENLIVDAIEDNDDDEIILNRTNHHNDIFGEDNDFVDENSRLSSTSNDIAAIKKKYGYANGEFGMIEDVGNKNDDFGLPKTSYPTESLYPPPVYETKKVTIPERFVCNSSPLDNCQRYLKYNQYGIIRSYVNENAKTSGIEIEFHDKNVHADIIHDNFDTNYQIGDLSLKVVALASLEKKHKNALKTLDNDEEIDTQGTSELYVIPISSFDKQNWSLKMPRYDGVIDVLVSETQVVVLTASRNVRVFSISGVQRQIFSHPGPILTAALYTDRLAISSVASSDYYESDSKKMAQWKFELHEYNLNIRECETSNGAVTKVTLPVSGGEQLEWISYSSKGKLVMMDSSYNVLIHTPSGLWIPIFDGSSVLRSQSDGIFAYAVLENNITNEFRYLYCRGTKYPLVTVSNSPITVPWKMPFCQQGSDRTKLEQELFSAELSLSDALIGGELDTVEKLEKHILATIIKSFALAVKSNCDGRAVELAGMVRSSKGVQMLCNYATKNKKTALANKVAMIGCDIIENKERSAWNRRKEAEQDDNLKPRNIMKGKKRNEKTVSDDAPTTSARGSIEPMEYEEESPSVFDDSQLDDSFVPAVIPAILPTERATKNPFLKSNSAASADNGSILDQLEKTTERKRPGNDENCAPPVKKQKKLSFTAKPEKKQKTIETTVVQNDETETVEVPAKKTVSPFDLWFAEENTALRSRYSGEDSGFSKFCIQQFRILSKEEKENWKMKALQTNTL